MENAEEILQCLDEFSKLKPKDIPRELEEYLCFVAKTGDPVYQWPVIKCLFREKLLNVITEFYETCRTVEIPPCPNVDAFNYDSMKNFILEKLDTFAAAPFTVQRICELLTSPRKEYNRIDKYMRALEKNILVVSTREPGTRKSPENGENIVNGLESEHISQEITNSDINVEVEMDEAWQKTEPNYTINEANIILDSQPTQNSAESVQESVIRSRGVNYIGYTPNITDLIIEPAPTADNAESQTVFAISAEFPVEHAPESTETDTAFDKASVSVCAKADCSETAFSSVVQLEPEPSLVQIEPSSTTDQSTPLVEEPSPASSSTDQLPADVSASTPDPEFQITDIPEVAADEKVTQSEESSESSKIEPLPEPDTSTATENN